MTQINCTGDVVTGDIVTFAEGVFGGSFKRPKYLGERAITARVVKDSYGAAKQQHTFTIEVIESTGYDPLKPGTVTTRKGRNIYRNGVTRLAWADEAARKSAVDEKHMRGDQARAARDVRKEFY
jgi:hypothetical protein